jgi:hypothetical protein
MHGRFGRTWGIRDNVLTHLSQDPLEAFCTYGNEPSGSVTD